jgi:hypothetical protein
MALVGPLKSSSIFYVFSCLCRSLAVSSLPPPCSHVPPCRVSSPLPAYLVIRVFAILQMITLTVMSSAQLQWTMDENITLVIFRCPLRVDNHSPHPLSTITLLPSKEPYFRQALIFHPPEFILNLLKLSILSYLLPYS